jgi:spoIIIJ-associated protein
VEWVETTGRTLEEAKDAALDQLGVDEQDAEFEILEEPKVGLFGRLRTEARVRARVRPTRPRPKEDRRDRRRKKSAGEQGGRTNGNGGPTRLPARSAKATSEKTSEKRGSDVDGDEDVPLGEQAAVAEAFLTGLLAELGSEGTVTWREVDEDTVEVAITGDELGSLIGPKGATLTALQDVTRTVVQRRTGGRNGRLFVDVAGYRQKRREALERFTKEVAATVQETGERRALEPMHPADRKVVHDTVNALPGVRTISEGEEPRRRVVILAEE